MWRLYGRTHSRASGNPDVFVFPGFRLSRAVARSAGMTVELVNEFRKHHTNSVSKRLALRGETGYPVIGGPIQVHGIFRKGSIAQAALLKEGMVHTGFGKSPEKRTSIAKSVSLLGQNRGIRGTNPEGRNVGGQNCDSQRLSG